MNKADRPGVDVFVRNLQQMLHPSQLEVPVVKTVADQNVGIDVLFEKIKLHKLNEGLDKHHWLLTEKAYQFITGYPMVDSVGCSNSQGYTQFFCLQCNGSNR